MGRAEALALVREKVKNKNLIKHMLATEAVMLRLAEHFEEDRALWGLVGLLHDVDYDLTNREPARHGLVGAQMLEERGLPPELVQAVRAHNDALGYARVTRLDRALYAVDPITGLLVAAALVHPDKKLSAIDVQFILKRFKEKSFARGANREQIETCTELGLSLEQFIGLSLEAMQGIATELGL